MYNSFFSHGWFLQQQLNYINFTKLHPLPNKKALTFIGEIFKGRWSLLHCWTVHPIRHSTMQLSLIIGWFNLSLLGPYSIENRPLLMALVRLRHRDSTLFWNFPAYIWVHLSNPFIKIVQCTLPSTFFASTRQPLKTYPIKDDVLLSWDVFEVFSMKTSSCYS